jgi:nucleoside-diphosphate-sugar epimerase
VYEAARVRMNPARLSRLLWSYVDIRDAARACRLAVESAPAGFNVLNITARDTLASTPTMEMLAKHTPEVEIRASIAGFASAWSIERAERLIGFSPAYSWRDNEAT